MFRRWEDCNTRFQRYRCSCIRGSYLLLQLLFPDQGAAPPYSTIVASVFKTPLGLNLYAAGTYIRAYAYHLNPIHTTSRNPSSSSISGSLRPVRCLRRGTRAPLCSDYNATFEIRGTSHSSGKWIRLNTESRWFESSGESRWLGFQWLRKHVGCRITR